MLWCYRGVAGTTKVGGGGGQTPRKLQAPVFLVLFINHKTHLTSPQSRSTHLLVMNGKEYALTFIGMFLH